MNQAHKCATCQRSDIKLYRPYGEFLRDRTIRCKNHIPDKIKAWYVPLVEDTDGSVWGYTYVPNDAIERWEKLLDTAPEKSYNGNANGFSE